MSYAIESKKRKFERILESLTDHTTHSQSRVSPNEGISYSGSSIIPLGRSDSSKRRRVIPQSHLLSTSTSTASLTTHYLPSSRTAFLERLETFRNVTRWHIPSTSHVNAAEWAKRGWLCDDTDTVRCPSCKERVYVDLDVGKKQDGNEDEGNKEEDVNSDEDHAVIENAIYEGLVQRYKEMVVTAHKEVCPWRRRGCDSSIQRIEGLLNTPNALATLQPRYESIILHAQEVPLVAQLTTDMPSQIDEHELELLRFGSQTSTNVDIAKLAICGWQRKEADVLECRHCFRSLGLWLYRGNAPTIEQLDPIESHLEYCPWRSSMAQDTEAIVPNTHGQGIKKDKFPGWMLIYLAVVKNNARRSNGSSHSSAPPPYVVEDASTPQELSPEQREKRMKDLRRRIRDLKKPFNIKALLRRKEK